MPKIEGLMTLWRLSLLLAVGARAATIEWREGMSASEQSLTVRGDERITFAWTGNHNVRMVLTEEEFDACDLDDEIVVSDKLNDRSPYTILSASSLAYYYGGYDTPIYFVCSVGTHCKNDQKIAITVTHGDEDEHEDHGNESEDADELAGHDHGEDEHMEESDGTASIAPALGAAGTVVVLAALAL